MQKKKRKKKKQLKICSATMQSFKFSLDRQEVYSKRNCLLVYGIPENRNKNIDQIVIRALRKKIQYKKYGFQK